jgi:hypothetical protein
MSVLQLTSLSSNFFCNSDFSDFLVVAGMVRETEQSLIIISEVLFLSVGPGITRDMSGQIRLDLCLV